MARPKTKTKKHLGKPPRNIFQRFQAAKDNVALDCADMDENFPPYRPVDIKMCEDRAISLIDEFFTDLQRGKLKASDVSDFEKRALKNCLKQTEKKGALDLDLAVCQDATIKAASRIRIALQEDLGKKRRR